MSDSLKGDNVFDGWQIPSGIGPHIHIYERYDDLLLPGSILLDDAAKPFANRIVLEGYANTYDAADLTADDFILF